MHDLYKLAALAGESDIIQDISKYEEELKMKMKQEVVLIAYTRESEKQ